VAKTKIVKSHQRQNWKLITYRTVHKSNIISEGIGLNYIVRAQEHKLMNADLDRLSNFFRRHFIIFLAVSTVEWRR
jgi:hypothetical protein